MRFEANFKLLPYLADFRLIKDLQGSYKDINFATDYGND